MIEISVVTEKAKESVRKASGRLDKDGKGKDLLKNWKFWLAVGLVGLLVVGIATRGFGLIGEVVPAEEAYTTPYDMQIDLDPAYGDLDADDMNASYEIYDINEEKIVSGDLDDDTEFIEDITTADTGYSFLRVYGNNIYWDMNGSSFTGAIFNGLSELDKDEWFANLTITQAQVTVHAVVVPKSTLTTVQNESRSGLGTGDMTFSTLNVINQSDFSWIMNFSVRYQVNQSLLWNSTQMVWWIDEDPDDDEMDYDRMGIIEGEWDDDNDNDVIDSGEWVEFQISQWTGDFGDEDEEGDFVPAGTYDLDPIENGNDVPQSMYFAFIWEGENVQSGAAMDITYQYQITDVDFDVVTILTNTASFAA